MARFVFWSDLHGEHQGFDLPSLSDFGGPIDGVLLPGDIDSGMALCHVTFMEKVARAYGVPVVAVTGNHEYYGCEMHSLHAEQQRALAQLRSDGLDVHILDGDSVEIAGVRVVGATLWTDYELDPAIALRARQLAGAMMNDHRLIKIDDGGPRTFLPDDAAEMHRAQFSALKAQIQSPFEGPTVVMTHHMPAAQLVHAQYLHHPLNAAFASNRLRDIEGWDFDVWLFGHSHQNNEIVVETGEREKRFLSNPRGYPNEPTAFDPLRVFEI